MSDTPRTRQLDVGSLIWALILAAFAALAISIALGHTPDWSLIKILAPVYLILLGLLGLVLSRHPG